MDNSGEGGKIGLRDRNYYVQNRYSTRIYCTAQGTIAIIL